MNLSNFKVKWRKIRPW